MTKQESKVDTKSSERASQAQSWLNSVSRNYRCSVANKAAELRVLAMQRFTDLENIKDSAQSEGVEGVDLGSLLEVIDQEQARVTSLIETTNKIIRGSDSSPE